MEIAVLSRKRLLMLNLRGSVVAESAFLFFWATQLVILWNRQQVANT